MQVCQLRAVLPCALIFVAACSRGVDTAPATDADSNSIASSSATSPPAGDAGDWRHLVPHTAPFGPARSRAGRLEGPVTLWHENGIKSAQGEYRNEQRQGLWQFWYPNGTLRWEGALDHDDPIGLQRGWFENGHLQSEGTWLRGELEGPFSAWHENGRVALRCEFKSGHESGEVWRWNEDGDLDTVVSGVYRGGQRVSDLPATSLSASAKH